MKIKGFTQTEQVASILNAANQSQQNIVLYGKGGYGKSEMSVAFLKSIGAREEQITIKSLSVGTSLDDLLGGINIKELRESGRILYNVDYSVFSTPYLILEEAFDAPVRILEGLKDILTSGKIRNGSQIYQIKTKFIIVCTNRSKEDLSDDDSSKALMERFPLSLKVEWVTHRLCDYQDLIQTIFGESNSTFDSLINYILTSIEEDDSKLPPCPRTAVRMYKMLKTAGIYSLKFLDGVPNIDKAINSFENDLKIFEAENQFMNEIRKLTLRKTEFTTETPIGEIKTFNDVLNTIYNKLPSKSKELKKEVFQNTQYKI